jgi:hypothetical protein
MYSLAGWYDNPCQSQHYPPSQGLRIGPQIVIFQFHHIIDVHNETGKAAHKMTNTFLLITILLNVLGFFLSVTAVKIIKLVKWKSSAVVLERVCEKTKQCDPVSFRSKKRTLVKS